MTDTTTTTQPRTTYTPTTLGQRLAQSALQGGVLACTATAISVPMYLGVTSLQDLGSTPATATLATGVVMAGVVGGFFGGALIAWRAEKDNDKTGPVLAELNRLALTNPALLDESFEITNTKDETKSVQTTLRECLTAFDKNQSNCFAEAHDVFMRILEQGKLSEQIESTIVNIGGPERDPAKLKKYIDVAAGFTVLNRLDGETSSVDMKVIDGIKSYLASKVPTVASPTMG